MFRITLGRARRVLVPAALASAVPVVSAGLVNPQKWTDSGVGEGAGLSPALFAELGRSDTAWTAGGPGTVEVADGLDGLLMGGPELATSLSPPPSDVPGPAAGFSTSADLSFGWSEGRAAWLPGGVSPTGVDRSPVPPLPAPASSLLLLAGLLAARVTYGRKAGV